MGVCHIMSDQNVTYLFPMSSNFSELFPDVEDIEITIVEIDGKFPPNEAKRSHKGITEIPKNFAACHGGCHQGGTELEYIIPDMISNKQEHYEKKGKLCHGYMGSPKGKRMHDCCHHSFDITIEIKYKIQ